jgi:hypothetical protein
MSPQGDCFLFYFIYLFFFFSFMKGWTMVTVLGCGTPQNKLLINQPNKVLYIEKKIPNSMDYTINLV